MPDVQPAPNPTPKKMDWTKRPPTYRRYEPVRPTPESKNFSNTTLAILFGSGVVCLMIPFTMYLTPLFFGAGAYYGWKIRSQNKTTPLQR